jgi:hypothetical protein
MAAGGEGAVTYIRGIAEPLPPGEVLLWQGKPEFRSLLREAFHIRALLLYFGILALVPVYMAWGGAAAPGVPVLAQVAWLLLLAGIIGGMAALFALYTMRTTIYAVTDRRVILRIGVALPAVINMPLDKVGGVWQRKHRDGTGDLALSPRGTRGIGYLLLWPHARPWKVGTPEPMFRSISEVDRVGELLKEAVLALGALDRPVGEPSPVAWDLTGEADDPCGGHQPPSRIGLDSRASPSESAA